MPRTGTVVPRRGPRLGRFRYRTPALAGRWRDSREEALRDALNAHQAVADDTEPDGVRWLVAGEIEQESGADPLNQLIRKH